MTTYDIFKFLAFKIDPERAHNLGFRILSRFPLVCADLFSQQGIESQYETQLKCGLKWPFPIGLAAGLDKNAEAINFFSSLLFGAIEVGTVTPRPQEGNPKPRMFRLLEDQSLLNRMGFNNLGMDEILNNVKCSQRHCKVLGVNLGKNKETSRNEAPGDYKVLYQNFSCEADYIVINVSSPNTPGLREFQKTEGLVAILEILKEERKKSPCPLFLKISPDMAFEDLDALIQTAYDFNMAGLVATNTTIMPNVGQGGVSGKRLKERSRAMRGEILKRVGPNDPLDVIGVGGVDSFEDVYEFWSLGGRAIQIYTSFIYQGPSILTDIKKGIDKKLKELNLMSLEELFQYLSNRT